MTSTRDNGEVEFRFFRPNVSSVAVAGEFNGWSHSALRLRARGDGWWVGSARIEPGEYRFRYVADGQWYTDYAAHGVELDRYGWNSILIVPQVLVAEDELAETAERLAA